jgi:outer membrane lipoprotein-sorting protein
VNILRRLPLSRLLLVVGLVVAIGVSATALASALGSGPVPVQKPLARAVHDALTGPSVEGVSANITLTDHLLEGANLASEAGSGGGGSLLSSPLVKGGSGRLWLSKSGKVRLELQQEKGDTNIVYDGHTISVYDAASNTVYRYTPKQETPSSTGTSEDHGEAPSEAKIQEGIERIRKHANLSEATPTDVAGQPAYTVRLSPNETGSLIGGADVSFDAVHGTPLRAAIYSSTTSSPVIELAATEVNYGPVSDSVFQIEPPPGAKIEDLSPSSSTGSGGTTSTDHSERSVTTHGSGITSIVVAKTNAGKSSSSSSLGSLPQVDINGTKAGELKTALGTVLTFERSGARYIVAGALSPAPIEALARSL